MSRQPELALRRLEPQATACVHLVIPMAEANMGALFSRYLPLVAERLAVLGSTPAGAAFARTWEWGGAVADIEIGFPVAAPPVDLRPLSEVDRGEPGVSELPGGLACVALHRGPYSGLPAVYPKLREWIRSQGHTEGVGPWESYLDDPGEVDHAELRTEIVWPVT
jgi:effector-binding domain-containing protein